MNNNLSDKIKRIFHFKNGYSSHDQLSGSVIPEQFETAVLKHIICNNTAISVPNHNYPLLLGIQGPYGYGKTYMVKEICKNYNIFLTSLSSSQLSGEMEGDSKKKLQREYEAICIEVAKRKHCGLLLIDDFHLTIATEDTIGKTVNSNLLASYLMSLSDNPNIAGIRVPIILTGNNYKRVYPAIVRDGRMDIFTWNPTIDDIAPIVHHIFNSKFVGIENEIISTMIQQYSDMNIAFFEQISQDLMNSNIIQTINMFKTKKGGLSIAELSNSVRSSLSTLELTEDALLFFCQRRKASILLDFENSTKNKVENGEES
ncbi:MAG: AAA family ATPase [Oscillospiraceae bacterium]|nr:AAA family ATPase [Oscillospiraceae bacterium]